MNRLSYKILIFSGLLMLFGQQTAFADNSRSFQRDSQGRRGQISSANVHKRAPTQHRLEKRREFRNPSYKHYYKPGYRVNPLPYGHRKVFVNSTEYSFYDGFFYRPSASGYVVVQSPIGAIVASIPRLHRLFNWHNQSYYAVGNTFYRKHPKGYVVVPDPGYNHRR